MKTYYGRKSTIKVEPVTLSDSNSSLRKEMNDKKIEKIEKSRFLNRSIDACTSYKKRRNQYQETFGSNRRLSEFYF